ncbi:MAG: 16S rRNA processing protein RimM [Firmicutes bacterium]|nr:16S rRNA processing protein RimM [Bacillota bacterium]
MKPDYVSVGEVVAPHGIRGDVRLRPETDFPERFPGRRVRLGMEGPWRRILDARPHRGGLWILRLEGVSSREAAEALRGARLWVATAELPTLPAGRYYHHELIGLAVRTVDGRDLGRLAEILRTGANDVFVVRGPLGEVLLPALRSVVASVDLAAGAMTVAPPPGSLPGEDEKA